MPWSKAVAGLVVGTTAIVAACSSASPQAPAALPPTAAATSWPSPTAPTATATASVASPAGTAAAVSPPVPPEFQALFQDLDQRLTNFRVALGTAPALPSEAAFGAELLTANGNRGEALLTPANREGNVLLLDRLQGLGAGGVTVDIPYPLLLPSFPRHGEYLAFYRDSIADLQRRTPYAELYARDVYSFWEPLDRKFLDAIVALGRLEKIDFTSFYWATYLFSYLDYAATPKGLSRAGLFRLENEAAFRNIQAGATSGTGAQLKQLLAP